MLYEIDGKPAFRIDLYDHAVAYKWKNLIESIYVGDGEDIDHKRSFFSLWQESEIQLLLLETIKKINSFLKKDFISIPKNINWKDQKFYNNLHMKFETLSGEFDNPTKLMKIAPMDIKESVRDLNYCVHVLEQRSFGRIEKKLPIQWTKKRNLTLREKLTDDEYELIQFHQTKNKVYLSYNELGKSYIDLYKDNLPIDYAATKNNHYIGADIFISLQNKKNIFPIGFFKWANENKIDPYEKKHGIGLIEIGKVELIDIDHLTKDSKIDIILERK